MLVSLLTVDMYTYIAADKSNKSNSWRRTREDEYLQEELDLSSSMTEDDISTDMELYIDTYIDKYIDSNDETPKDNIDVKNNENEQEDVLEFDIKTLTSDLGINGLRKNDEESDKNNPLSSRSGILSFILIYRYDDIMIVIVFNYRSKIS